MELPTFKEILNNKRTFKTIMAISLNDITLENAVSVRFRKL